MRFETFFRASSYAAVACGALALAVTGGAGIVLSALFAAVMAAAWALEGTRWQLPERAGLVVVLLAVPAFYLDWQYLQAGGSGEVRAGVAALVHLTFFLSAVKLLQVKTDRDWLFLYLIAFFEVLLAAGLSVSPFYVGALIFYLFCALTSAICFELRKARRAAPERETRVVFAEGDSRRRLFGVRRRPRARALRRIPLAAAFLLLLIFSFALPIFFITPRFGDSAFSYAGEQATGFVGFSDKVSLGDVASLQRSDRLVMRVRVGGTGSGGYLRWRGVTLDRFDGRTWRRSSNESTLLLGGGRELFQFGTTEHLNRLTEQTFFVEPLDTPVMFAASRAVAVRGALDFVRVYSEGGALTTRRGAGERMSYRVYSDTVSPPADVLRADNRRRSPAATDAALANYLQLPPALDPRVAELARRVVADAGARNDYDRARAVEAHLNRNEFGGSYSYALEGLPGGSDPLADFLFRARAGHCEYFSTTMAVMLRSLGVPARVVNGFQMGEYNAAADAYFVRQHDAHSWVEVYFPAADAWVEFDPTPVAGRPGSAQAAGWGARLRQLGEAFELFWIQYVVAYDREEQRTLAGSIRRGLGSYREALVRAGERLQSALSSAWAGGDEPEAGGRQTPSRASFIWPLLLAAAAVAAFLVARVVRRRRAGRAGQARDEAAGASASAVVFYERMTRALAARGHARAADQTPLEFAAALNSPEARRVTDAYNRVRYGERNLTTAETADIEKYLAELEREVV
ncbi:MAG TPA: DUF3488 and transglutaminase-like domain-containing protein [Pyrinomonadaceae bacterium]|nr:DUF3488 and transglutaminase-like domain-containing protein [Pyrinomonadaceae bacterium]